MPLVRNAGEMGMRLIDADALKARIIEDVPGFLDGGSTITKAFILAMLGTRNATPTIDAVPVVRCKDCKYLECTDLAGDCICDINGEHHDPDWFCADGERKGETEIIRCKDCKHFIAENQPCKYRGMYIPLKPDNYCSHGERRDDDALQGEGYKRTSVCLRVCCR